jgi:CubicO group peptidase (beta-lactamase class C family)
LLRVLGIGASISCALLTVSCAAGDPSSDLASEVDAVVAGLADAGAPGCAVALSEDGEESVARAFGLANLEHDIPNTPVTVFEPGSVSKQFVAAAVVLLAIDGEISLEDDIAQYFPELPDYGEPVTVRQLMNHTSGLRDWGSIAGIHGWPRTTRVHTHEHMLDITRRQESLNYPPGEYYSYTNTGFNLLSVLVERVSGRSLDEFSQERLFGPLGMTRTEWRDDFTEIVTDRATAYVPNGEGSFSQLMPFEDIYGNGGLLSTVGDLLRFTHNLASGDVGGPRFVDEMHRQAVLDSGREIEYAGGVFVGQYRGVPEIRHAGATAGYRGFLSRFPDQGVAVAVMCNNGGMSAPQLAHQVAEIYLSGAIDENIPRGLSRPAVDVPTEALEALAGGYRDSFTGGFVVLSISEGRLRVNGTPLSPVSTTRFEGASSTVLEFEPPAMAGRGPVAYLSTQVLERARLEPIESGPPESMLLEDYAGEYRSDEAEVTYWIEVDGSRLRSRQRYDVMIDLTPVYEDAFSGFGATFIFERDAGGEVVGFSMSRGRVWDLDFRRVR